MSTRLTILAAFVAIFALFVGESAYADQLNCFTYNSVRSRALFNNTGTYATEGPALIDVTECAHQKTGIYGNVFVLLPLDKFDVGKEFDARLGIRPKVAGLDVDGSIAWYGFTVGDTKLQTLNFRLRLGHTFPLATDMTLELFGMLDYQHSLTLGTDWVGLAAGAVLNAKLPLPGTPNLRLVAESWKWPVITTPGSGPLGSVTASLGFPIPGTKLAVGPQAQVTMGGIDTADRTPIRKSFGVFVFAPFGF